MTQAEAAALLILASRISDRVSLSSPESAVEQIVALCRRFPLFVERLRTRQRQRVPLDKIKDEVRCPGFTARDLETAF